VVTSVPSLQEAEADETTDNVAAEDVDGEEKRNKNNST
jgi:hypothetical protein